MDHSEVAEFLGLLVIILATAKLFGFLASRIGQPSVLGELVAGVVLGMSVLGVVDSHNKYLYLLSQIGVVILLFEIGLETNLRKLLQVGPTSAVVAIVGVALPFALGYSACLLLGFENLVAIVIGATLTATSVGITARVLSDLKRLDEPESQIILGAAVIDDVIGLIILAVVSGIAGGKEVTALDVARTTAIAFGFLIGVLVIGRFIVPPIAKGVARLKLSGGMTIFGLLLAFGLAWLASVAGSAMIIGAFAAGVLLKGTPQGQEAEKGVAHLGHFFVPLFFVIVGAAVDVRILNPLDAANHRTLMVAGILIVVAVIGKFAAGYAPFWFKGNKKVVGIGMIPRGEVGLIFAQMGLASGVFDLPLFSAVTLMVMATTFIAPPLLRIYFPPRLENRKHYESQGIEDLVN